MYKRQADIQHDADVEILNPDLHIAYLDEGASVNMELTANHGRGYVPVSYTHLISESAKAKIEAAGGKVEVL